MESPRELESPIAMEKVPLGQSAYAELEQMIITLQLPPGVILSEMELIQRTRFGRTPIREALQRLERERLVRILPRRGIMVAELNVASQLKLLEVRWELERPLARYAAERATSEQRRLLGEFAAAITAAAEADDRIAFIQISKRIYTELIAAAHNEYFYVLELFHGLSRRFWFAHSRSRKDLEGVVRVQTTRLEQIINGDAQQAETATDTMMMHLQEYARATFDNASMYFNSRYTSKNEAVSTDFSPRD